MTYQEEGRFNMTYQEEGLIQLAAAVIRRAIDDIRDPVGINASRTEYIRNANQALKFLRSDLADIYTLGHRDAICERFGIYIHNKSWLDLFYESYTYNRGYSAHGKKETAGSVE